MNRKTNISTLSTWLIAAALCLFLLSACGQKGKLYLPEESASDQTNQQ